MPGGTFVISVSQHNRSSTDKIYHDIFFTSNTAYHLQAWEFAPP